MLFLEFSKLLLSISSVDVFSLPGKPAATSSSSFCVGSYSGIILYCFIRTVVNASGDVTFFCFQAYQNWHWPTTVHLCREMIRTGKWEKVRQTGRCFQQKIRKVGQSCIHWGSMRH